MQIFVDDARESVVVILQPEAAERVRQRVARHFGEIPIVPHQRAQPGVFELLDAPDLGDDVAVAGERVLGDVGHRLDVVKGAIGVENNGFDGHGGFSFAPMVAYRNFLSASMD